MASDFQQVLRSAYNPEGSSAQAPSPLASQPPGTFYKKLAEILGGVRGDPAASRGEYWDIPEYGTIRTQPVSPEGWDTSEVWMTNAAGGAPVSRYKEGEIPDWLQQGIKFMLAGAGKLSPEEMGYIARHWTQGEGVAPGYQAAQAAMPSWVKAWLEQQFKPYL